MINALKEKLNEMIKKHGIESKQVYHASVEVDKELIKYYENTTMKYFYLNSISALNKYVSHYGIRPSIKQWNHIAKQKGYLSSESLKYIGNIQLKTK